MTDIPLLASTTFCYYSPFPPILPYQAPLSAVASGGGCKVGMVLLGDRPGGAATSTAAGAAGAGAAAAGGVWPGGGTKGGRTYAIKPSHHTLFLDTSIEL